MVFAHDGLHDSLTRLAAPPYFYESLKREISIATRSKSVITVIRYQLESDDAESQQETNPIYDETLIAFADLISHSFRLEDYKARLGEKEFVVLIQGNEELSLQISQRLIAGWAFEVTPSVVISYSCATHVSGESALEVMNRLDNCKLLRATF
jgi:diguanylate cyclase (GGDEF)-like protein